MEEEFSFHLLFRASDLLALLAGPAAVRRFSP